MLQAHRRQNAHTELLVILPWCEERGRTVCVHKGQADVIGSNSQPRTRTCTCAFSTFVTATDFQVIKTIEHQVIATEEVHIELPLLDVCMVGLDDHIPARTHAVDYGCRCAGLQAGMHECMMNTLYRAGNDAGNVHATVSPEAADAQEAPLPYNTLHACKQVLVWTHVCMPHTAHLALANMMATKEELAIEV